MGFVEQFSCTKTHEGGTWDDGIFVHNVSRPECFCHSRSLLFHIVLRNLIKVSTDNHVRPPTEATRDKVRETLPVATGKLLEGDNGNNGI